MLHKISGNIRKLLNRSMVMFRGRQDGGYDEDNDIFYD